MRRRCGSYTFTIDEVAMAFAVVEHANAADYPDPRAKAAILKIQAFQADADRRNFRVVA